VTTRPGSFGAPRGLAPLLPVLFAAAIALVLVGAFVVLDYRMQQDPHRLVKILIAVSAMGAIVIWPRVGLLVLPVVTPFLAWLPRIPVPGVNILNILVFSVFFFWALRRVLARQPLFRKNRLGIVFGLILAVAALSIVRGAAFPTGFTYDAHDAGIELFRAAMTFALYFVSLSMARGRRDRVLVATAVVLGLFVEAAWTIRLGRNGHGARAIGSFGQSNELGAFLAMYTCFAAALMLGTRNLLARLFLLTTVLAGGYAIVLTLSRGAFLAVLAGLAFVGLRSSRWLLAAFVLVLATSPLWAPDYLKQRVLNSEVEVQGSDQATIDMASQIRVDTWRAILQIVSEHPLEGVGFNGLGEVLPGAGLALGVEVVETAHNTYLRFLGEMGVFGLALFVFLLWRCLKLSFDAARVAPSRFDRQFAVGLAAATVAMAVSCIFGDRFFSVLITGNFWLAMALADDIVLESKPVPKPEPRLERKAA
jgi:O-antigen ligase